MTLVSDDVAPDFAVTGLTAPSIGGAGLTLEVTDTTRNQGTGPSGTSTTSFYLSVNTLLDASDPLVGTRPVAALTPSHERRGHDHADGSRWDGRPGLYWIIAKADGPGYGRRIQ